MNRDNPLFGFDKSRNLFHGPWAVKGYHGRDVAKISRLEFLYIAAHAAAFQLENAFSFS